MQRVAVFCGSRHGAEPAYRRAAEELAALLVQRELGLVYGGGNVGLMGVLADSVMAGGGEVIGVIPEKLRAREVAHQGITDLQVVGSMHERKERIYRLADAVVALPGGIGTFEELFEALTWNQLGIHRKPCGLLNVEGYYDPLVAMIERAHEMEFFLRHRELLAVASDAGALLDELAARAEKPA
ncbi:MAG TPA: TIGR00730 family Rossman fold protein [Thermoanaerobaculia bacterium]|jgi:hypothetical protein